MAYRNSGKHSHPFSPLFNSRHTDEQVNWRTRQSNTRMSLDPRKSTRNNRKAPKQNGWTETFPAESGGILPGRFSGWVRQMPSSSSSVNMKSFMRGCSFEEPWPTFASRCSSNSSSLGSNRTPDGKTAQSTLACIETQMCFLEELQQPTAPNIPHALVSVVRNSKE